MTYLYEGLETREREIERLIRRRAVVVPDSDCAQAIDLLGQEIDTNVAVKKALYNAGFAGEYPEGISDWLASYRI